MEFWLKKENKFEFQLPVKPSDYTVSVAHKNTTVNVITAGDITLRGNTGLKDIPISSFFPARDYNFSNNSDRKDPLYYVEKIEECRKSDNLIRVIITGVLNMECTIESFVWGEQDSTGDIYYTLYLKEYVKPKINKLTKSNPTSTRDTNGGSSSGKSYTVKSGDSLWGIAKKFYGDGSKYMKIFEANKGKLRDPNVISVGQVLIIP